ncbi:MAG: PIG-L family deacetylase [Dehalococcoidales bacterium]|jgi:N-acetyl-1-D-myo-inositol-2-amino-2-deoxy-alpha-D-glucopyranoside deacetylase/mycothiol S-conjugate amidase
MADDRVLVLAGAHPDDESFGVGGTLAQYAADGVKVYYICATRGEVGEVEPEMLKGYESIADLRTHELECAGKALGLTGVIYLGYRDSGMAGTADNKHPQALAAAPLDEAAGRIVKILRKLKPQVVITFDPIGGYHHPDHIAIHQATVKAFQAAADAAQYPEAGPPYRPQKLYYHVFPHRWLKFTVRVMTLLGRDMHHFGKNRDIDLAEMTQEEFPVHAVVRLKKPANEMRARAAACHASQMGGGGPRGRGLMGVINRLLGQKDSFMRGYPPVKGRRKEKDLFEGVV